MLTPRTGGEKKFLKIRITKWVRVNFQYLLMCRRKCQLDAGFESVLQSILKKPLKWKHFLKRSPGEDRLSWRGQVSTKDLS